MPTIPARNKCNPVVVAAIQAVVLGFTHKCNCTLHKEVYVPGSLLDEYCMAVNGTKTNLLGTGQYQICHNLAFNVIKRKLNKNSSVRTTKIDSNNNTTTKEVHADSNNNNNTGFVLLVPKEEDGVDEDCSERCRVAGIQFAAERSAAATTTRATTRATTRSATAFGHEYENPIMPKGVDTVYRIVHKTTGSLGGNGSGGAIYGELTKSSMHKLVKLMVASTNLGPKSRFLDVGSGLGKPNLHVAQYPGVKVSIGIELKRERWMLSLSNLKACLKTAATDAARHGPADPSGGHGPADPSGGGRVKGNTMFIQGDISKARTFDPFTHVYMFSVGFPPALWKRLATIWNNSNPNTCQYLICFVPEKKLEEYDFAVEFVAEADTSMHGSGEHHTVYLYKRSKPVYSLCDPLFQSSYNLLKRGLNPLKNFVNEQLNTEESCKRSRRSACMEESFVEDSSIDSSSESVIMEDVRAQPKKKRRRRKRRRKNTTTTKRVSRRKQGLQPELVGPELERPPRRRRRRARVKVREPTPKPKWTRRSSEQVFLDEIGLRRNELNYRKDLSSLSSQRLTQRIDWLVSLICAACAGKTEVKAMTKKETRKTAVPFFSSTLGLVFIARVKKTFEAITKSIEKKLDIEIGITGVDIMRIDAFATAAATAAAAAATTTTTTIDTTRPIRVARPIRHQVAARPIRVARPNTARPIRHPSRSIQVGAEGE